MSNKKQVKLKRVIFKSDEGYEIEDIVAITQFNGGIVVLTKDGSIYSEKLLSIQSTEEKKCLDCLLTAEENIRTQKSCRFSVSGAHRYIEVQALPSTRTKQEEGKMKNTESNEELMGCSHYKDGRFCSACDCTSPNEEKCKICESYRGNPPPHVCKNSKLSSTWQVTEREAFEGNMLDGDKLHA